MVRSRQVGYRRPYAVRRPNISYNVARAVGSMVGSIFRAVRPSPWTNRLRQSSAAPRYRPGTSRRGPLKDRYVPMSSMTYKTRGYSGKAFKKAKRLRRAKYDVSMLRETGGVVSDVNCVYVGHATCVPTVIMQEVARAMSKKLWHRWIGNSATTQDGFNAGAATYVMRLTYQTAPNVGSNTNIDYNLTGVIYEADLSNVIWDALNDVMIGAPGKSFNISKVGVFGPSGFSEPRANISLEKAMVDILMTSKLVLQNRTIADSGTGADNRNDVANNPLVGKKYQSGGNFLDAVARSVTYQSITAGEGNGLIVANGDNFALYGQKPPPASFFNATRATSVSLEPGQMKTDYLRSQKTMSLDYLFAALRDAIVETPCNVNMGTVAMFGLEKKLNSRVDEPTVSVGYERTGFVGVRLMLRDHILPPRLVIDP